MKYVNEYTHNAPAKKRSKIRRVVLSTNAEINENVKPHKAPRQTTFCRPHTFLNMNIILIYKSKQNKKADRDCFTKD